MRRYALLLSIASVALAADLPGQNSSYLRGRVVSDADGAPVAGALVALDAGRRTLTDSTGWFRLDDLAPGPYRIAAVGRGCVVSMGEVEVPNGAGAVIELALPPAPALPGEGGAWDPDQRSTAAAARSMEAEEIRRRGFRSVTDVVRALAPAMVGRESAGTGFRQEIQGRSRSTVGGSTEPLVIVDGVRITQRATDALAMIDPATVRRVSVVRGTAGGWGYGTQAVNGVILIETLDRPVHDATTPPGACDFRFPM